MRTKLAKPFLFLTVFILIIGFACNLVSPSVPTAAPAPAVNEPAPVEPPPAEAAPQLTPVPPTEALPPTEVPPTEPVSQQFFTEEFDYDTGNWDAFYTGSGDSDKAVFSYADSHLSVDLGDENIYMYYIYLPYNYDHVKATMSAENRGRNNNNVSLVCNFSDAGWYEFSVESGGLWYLYAKVQDDAYGHIGYNIIGSGGVKALKQGKEVNEYSLECDGNELTLSVNGDELKTIKDGKYFLPGGMVGFNISSLNVLPIVVNVDWFRIEQP